jgi:hypothetical protein
MISEATTNTKDDFGLRPEQTVYLNLQELADLLHHARVTGSLAMYETRPPGTDFALEVPDNVVEFTAEMREHLGAGLVASSQAAPEGRHALTWGALGNLVRIARLAGALAAIGKPWKATARRLYKMAKAEGFDVDDLVAAMNLVAASRRGFNGACEVSREEAP